jgi:hypothetical protein
MILVRSPRSVLSHFTIGSISSSDIEVPEELSATAQPCVRRFLRGLRHRADVDAASPTARLPRRGTALPSRAGRSRLTTSPRRAEYRAIEYRGRIEVCDQRAVCHLSASITHLDLAKRPTGVGSRVPVLSVPAVRRERHYWWPAHIADRIPPVAILAAQRRRRRRRLTHVGDGIPPLPVLAIERLRRAGCRGH